MILMLKFVLERFDVFGINVRWKEVSVFKEECIRLVIEWYWKYLLDDELIFDFVEVLFCFSEEGKLLKICVKLLIFVRLLKKDFLFMNILE